MKVIRKFNQAEFLEIKGARLIRFDAENWMIAVEADDLVPRTRYHKIDGRYFEKIYQEEK